VAQGGAEAEVDLPGVPTGVRKGGAKVMVLRFSVEGPPRPKGRHRTRVVKRKGASGQGRGDYLSIEYPDPADVAEEKRIAAHCLAAMRQQRIAKATGAVALFVLAAFRLPASLSRVKRAERIWHTQRPDADNCAKLVADALNGSAWDDDAQIVFGPPFKAWSATWEGYSVWVAHLPSDPEGACAAFRELRGLSALFIAEAERLTLEGRWSDAAGTLGLEGIGRHGTTTRM